MDKEILQLRLVNAQLMKENVNLKGILLSKDLELVEKTIQEIETQLSELSDE